MCNYDENACLSNMSWHAFDEVIDEYGNKRTVLSKEFKEQYKDLFVFSDCDDVRACMIFGIKKNK